MPGLHKEALGGEEVGVGAGEDLGRGPVELEDSGVGWWECWGLS
jgi:hypothetical protein